MREQSRTISDSWRPASSDPYQRISSRLAGFAASEPAMTALSRTLCTVPSGTEAENLRSLHFSPCRPHTSSAASTGEPFPIGGADVQASDYWEFRRPPFDRSGRRRPSTRHSFRPWSSNRPETDQPTGASAIPLSSPDLFR